MLAVITAEATMAAWSTWFVLQANCESKNPFLEDIFKPVAKNYCKSTVNEYYQTVSIIC